MERASRLIRALNLPGDTLSVEDLVRTVWPVAVGKKISAHTRPTRMVRNCLIVEVEDPIWQRQAPAPQPGGNSAAIRLSRP